MRSLSERLQKLDRRRTVCQERLAQLLALITIIDPRLNPS